MVLSRFKFCNSLALTWGYSSSYFGEHQDIRMSNQWSSSTAVSNGAAAWDHVEPENDEFGSLDVSTRIIHTHPQKPSQDVDPMAVPIYQTAAYRIHSLQHYVDILDKKGYIYQRLGNPTTEAAATVIKELEGGVGTIMFCGGLAAVNAVFLAFLKCGDHLIYPTPVYSATFNFIKKTLERFGVETDSVPAGASVDAYKQLIKPNTRMLYAETPANPTLAITDLEAFGALGKNNPNILTVVDGTFASPYLQQPLKYGVSISVHSCSMYLGGHADLIAGSVTLNDVQLWKELKAHAASSGGILAPFDSYLLLRGIKTLPLRIQCQCTNAMAVARFLETHPKVTKVWYPGLPSHPQHQLAKKQMKKFGGMISFELASLKEATRMLNSLKLIGLALSYGGVESLIEHPAIMSHGNLLMSDAERLEHGITDGLIRLSVGIEEKEDLINDLKRALDSC